MNIYFPQNQSVYKLKVRTAGLCCLELVICISDTYLVPCMSPFLNGVIIVMDVSALATASCVAGKLETV